MSGFDCDDLLERLWAYMDGEADEQARSRIYGGIHFHFDTIAGQEIGTKIGNYLIDNFMLPRSR